MSTEQQRISPSRPASTPDQKAADPETPADPADTNARAYTPQTLAAKLHAAFTKMPSEPGYDHPAADRIISTLHPTDANIAALSVITSDPNGDNPHLAWDTLIRIAHTNPAWPTAARMSIVSRALASDSPMIRDGAIQLAEAWADQAMLQLLQNHHDTSQQLAAYVSDVISDITMSLRPVNA